MNAGRHKAEEPSAAPEANGGDKEQGFDELVARLEAIVEDLESGEMRLERSLELFEEGVRVSREASRRLDEAERRIEELLEDGSTAPVDDAG